MDEKKAREILKEYIRPDNSLFDKEGGGVKWPGYVFSISGEPATVILKDQFTSAQLMAIAWWMENMKVKE